MVLLDPLSTGTPKHGQPWYTKTHVFRSLFFNPFPFAVTPSLSVPNDCVAPQAGSAAEGTACITPAQNGQGPFSECHPLKQQKGKKVSGKT